MAYKLFVSHSSLDAAPVEILRSLRLPGIELYIAEDDPRLGDLLSEKIEHEIDSSDALVAFLTKHGGESASVNQEVGYAKRADKRIIAVVEEELKVGVLIQGVEIIQFSKDKFEDAIKQLIRYVTPKAIEKRRNWLLWIGFFLVIIALIVVAVSWKFSSIFSRKKDPTNANETSKSGPEG